MSDLHPRDQPFPRLEVKNVRLVLSGDGEFKVVSDVGVEEFLEHEDGGFGELLGEETNRFGLKVLRVEVGGEEFDFFEGERCSGHVGLVVLGVRGEG